jgi:hypothetical protein
MPGHHLAQINVARMRHPLEDPRMAEFVGNLERINAIADASPGFVWRLKDDTGNATEFRPLEPDILVNMSVWESLEALRGFIYRTEHAEFLRRAERWFHKPDKARFVLWWVPAGTVPTVGEGIERLARLRAEGPGPEVFTFKERFPEPAEVE